MQALHTQFSGLNSTTDVLTFANNDSGAPIDCDIAVCVDEARRRAAELNHTVAQELLLYTLHGMLHAAGFDDVAPDLHAAMHAEEDRILTAIGVGPLFGTAAPGGAIGGAAPSAPEDAP
jgi:probable rRNA maturation factor